MSGYAAAIREGERRLAAAGIAEAALDARLLAEWCCGTQRQTFFLEPERLISAEEEARYQAALGRRERRVPLQQITGVQYFMGLEYTVTPEVLIPRPDTEILVEEVMKDGYAGARILDLCTGSGCILISLLHYGSSAVGAGCDLSEAALAVARENAARLLPEDKRAELAFYPGDLYAALPKEERRFDLIVSNPPYIASGEIPTLMPEVRDYEPHMALDGGADGLAFYRRILAEAPAHLTHGGRVYFEIGCDQAGALRGLLAEAGFGECRVVKDYAGLDRVVCAELI